jgi:hypothetical protein
MVGGSDFPSHREREYFTRDDGFHFVTAQCEVKCGVSVDSD